MVISDFSKGHCMQRIKMLVTNLIRRYRRLAYISEMALTPCTVYGRKGHFSLWGHAVNSNKEGQGFFLRGKVSQCLLLPFNAFLYNPRPPPISGKLIDSPVTIW